MSHVHDACISIDLDSLACYQAIYGLPVTPGDTRLYTRGLRRFLDLCREEHVRATLFTVAADLQQPDNRLLLEEAVAAGHEIANHSYHHDYRISRQPFPAIKEELSRARDELERTLGVTVSGFRAPGYNMNPALLRAVFESGHVYDSSLFPSLPYYFTRAAAIAVLQLRGRKSSSLVGDPRMMTAPLGPYRARTDAPWRRTRAMQNSIIEIPITVSDLPFGRLPLLGSLLALMGEGGWKLLYPAVKLSGRPLVFEFHAMDFIDGLADGLPPALLAQPDVKIPLQKKLSLFKNVIHSITKDYTVKPLAQVANTVA